MLAEGTTIVMDRYAYSGVAYTAAKVQDCMSKPLCLLNHLGTGLEMVQEP